MFATIDAELAHYLAHVRATFDEQRLSTTAQHGPLTAPFLSAALNYAQVGLQGDSRFRYQEQSIQTDWLQQQLAQARPSQVLELGCMTGFSIARLAEQHPEMTFYGIESDQAAFERAQQQLQARSSVRLVRADLNQPDSLPTAIDYSYALESLNRVADPEQMLATLHAHLSAGGTLVLFDRFRQRTALTDDEAAALQRCEAVYGAQNALTLSDFVQLAESIGFAVSTHIDLTAAILPTLRQFRSLQERLYPFPWFLPRQALPAFIRRNSTLGYLVPTLLAADVQRFYQISLTKTTESLPRATP